MLGVLLAKDLRRVWRNPLPALINIALPLCITAVIGMVFGGNTEEKVGRIHYALVDEDQSFMSGIMCNRMQENQANEYLDVVVMDRKAALERINRNELSGALIIRTNFGDDFFANSGKARLELIKNPAQSIQPAILEEFGQIVAARLNVHGAEIRSGAFGDEKEGAKPLVSVDKPGEPRTGGRQSPHDAPAFNIFAWALPGMTAMFLIFLAGNAMTDLQREWRFRTFERYHTFHQRMLPFILGKVWFTVVFLLLCGSVMLGGGAAIFHVHWNQPLALAAMAVSYAIFAAGLTALLTALMPDERRGGTLNSIAGMVLGMAGGCTFPRWQLPHFIGEHITPWLPSYWFADTARNLQSGQAGADWMMTTVKLLVLSAVLIFSAVAMFQQRFEAGRRE